MSEPLKLAYTFGNHMHWVDMEWLWGYGVLPGSTRDMLVFCREGGVKGCLNFDGIGLEKLAAECPESLASLRKAVEEGVIEPVGGSYGQPYGLFHGGESNIRQRTFGVRTILRLLGVRPRSFWEEEYDFYPQLPQILSGCGFTGASLYFQWTWHTPEIPKMDEPIILWEGVDGTLLPAAARGRLNLHQWPEDFQILLDDLAVNPPDSEKGTPLILQWLELMPSPDWMCRSELMLPMIQKLKADPRFQVEPMTLAEALSQSNPTKRWKPTPSCVWHGMTLGKNGDSHPRRSAELEHRLLREESAAAILSLFGRPYQPWDVYPTWEIEESWRNLLAAQHHDNHECQGLCGHVAEAQLAYVDKALKARSSIDILASRIPHAQGERLVFNRLSWPMGVTPHGRRRLTAPAMGFRMQEVGEVGTKVGWAIEKARAVYNEEGFHVEIDLASGGLAALQTAAGSIDWEEKPQPEFVWTKLGERVGPQGAVKAFFDGRRLEILLGGGEWLKVSWTAMPEDQELLLEISAEPEWELEPGLTGAIRTVWTCQGEPRADSPFAVELTGPGSEGKRKYPTGDWMTSPQWFEEVRGSFVSHSLVAWDGLQISHSGSQQWLRTESGVENVILARDPWDEGQATLKVTAHYLLSPGSTGSQSEMLKKSSRVKGMTGEGTSWPLGVSEHRRPPLEAPALPREFSALQVEPSSVHITSFSREEAAFAGKGLSGYAMPDVSHPFVIRLVEMDGKEAQATLHLPGPVARVCRTNLLGEWIEDLEVHPGEPGWQGAEATELAAFGIEAAKVLLTLRPHEIVTLVADIVPGRKVVRDLDAKREIWATIHRVDED
jgi:alpha-mannosidase